MAQKSPVTSEQIAEMIISDVLARWPETAVIFQKYNMACVGCVVAPFYELESPLASFCGEDLADTRAGVSWAPSGAHRGTIRR